MDYRKQYQTATNPDKHAKHGADHERAVKDTKQPLPTNKDNQSIRKTDPSHHSFNEEEE